jgi:hypothetical protein
MARSDGFFMTGLRVESSTAWAEDTALLGSNRSADPGAKTEGRAMGSVRRPFLSTPFGIGTQALNPAGRRPASLEEKKPGDGLPGV